MAGYKDFIDYIQQSSREELKKRKDATAARLRQQEQEQKSKDENKDDGKNPLEKALDFIGGVAKGTYESATSIPRKAITTIDTALHPDDMQSKISDLNVQYNEGKINQDELKTQFNELTKDIIGNTLTVTKKGIVRAGPEEQNVGFAKQFVGAGVDTASVIPVARGASATVDIAKEGLKAGAKKALLNNAKEAAVYGTAANANDAIQGNEVTPLSAIANYALPTAMGAGSELVGAGIKAGARSGANAVKKGITDFNAQPRAMREGGYMQVPGAKTASETLADPVGNLAQEVVPPTSRLAAPDEPNGVTPGDVLPTENHPGVTFKSREQIMKDNKSDRGFMSKLNEQLFDSNAPLKDLTKAYTKATGKVLDAADDPHALAQLRNGMDEAGAARLQSVVSDFDYVRKNNLSEDVKTYGVAQQVTNDRAQVYGPETVAAEARKLDEMQQRLGPEKFQQVQAATQRIIDFQDDQLTRLKDNGFISEEGYTAIKEFNPHYFTRFNIADYIQQNQKTFASTNSNNISKNIVQAVKGMGDDRKFVIEDPFEAVTRSAMKTENIIQQNKIFKSAQAIADVAPDMVVKLRNADDVTARMSLAGDNQELRPIRTQLDKLIKRDSGTVRKLQTEMNNLEKKGLSTALKGGGQRMGAADFTVSGLGGDVATSQTGKVSRTAPDEMTDLARQVEGAITKRAKGSTKAQGIIDEGIIEGAGTQAATTGSKMGAQDTASFVRNLIENGSRADIDRLKRSIGSRDAKVNNLLDEIGYTKSQYDEIAGKIKGNMDEAAAHADADVPDGYEAVSGWNNGIQERIALPQYIADAYKGKNDIQTGVMEKIFNATSKPFKAAATVLSPAFLVKNSIRDTGTHWLTSKNIPVADRLLLIPYAKRWVTGFMDSLTNSDFAKQITESGGGAAGVFTDKGNTDKIVRDVTKKISGVEVKTPTNMFKEAARILGKYSGIVPLAKAYGSVVTKTGRALEYAPRLAEARAAIEKGMSDPAAALAARNAIGDLQNGGTVSRVLNNFTPFFNSIVQGNKRVVDAIREDPKKMVGMLAAGVALPAVSGYVWNRTMYPDVLNNLSETDRENNFVIILGDNKDASGRYTDVIKIPKNDAAKVFGNNIEVALDKLAGQDSQSFAELFMKTIGYAQPVQVEKNGKLSMDAILGSAPVISSPLARVPIENATNHSFFTGREVVPDSAQGLTPEQQITDKTSPIDAALAKVGVSPYQAANARQGVSASLLGGKSPVDQVKNVVSGSNGSRAQTEFYKITDKVSANKASVNKYINDAIARGDVADAQAAAQSYNAYLREQFTPYSKQYGDQMTDDLIETYDGLKLNLTTRSIKSRQKNLQKK